MGQFRMKRHNPDGTSGPPNFPLAEGEPYWDADHKSLYGGSTAGNLHLSADSHSPAVISRKAFLDNHRFVSAMFRGIGAQQGAVALEFDDCRSTDYALVYPALNNRHLVGGFAIPSDYVGQAGNLTQAQLLTLQAYGNEIINHSKSHGAVSSYSDDDFIGEIVGARDTLIAMGLNVQFFTAPGTWTGDLIFDSVAKLDSFYADIVRTSHALMTIPVGHLYRPLPNPECYAKNMTLDALTLSGAQGQVNQAMMGHFGILFVSHSANFDTAGHMSSADFYAFLDWLVTMQAKGLKVLTPSGLFFADSTVQSTNLVNDGRFDLSSTGNFHPDWLATGAAAVVAGGGQNGHNAASVNYTTDTVKKYFAYDSCRTLHFKAYVQSAGTTTQARVDIRHGDNSTLRSIDSVNAPSGSWTPFEWDFCPPPNGDGYFFFILRSKTDDRMLYDDVQITKR